MATIKLTKTLLRHGVLQTTTIVNHPVAIGEARSQAARLFAIANLTQAEVARLVGRSIHQVLRWCKEPSFEKLVEHERRVAATVAVPDLVDPDDSDDDGGEWSPTITTEVKKR